MKHSLFSQVIIVIVCVLSSCDPYGSDEYHVVNNTHSSISVNIGDSLHIDTSIVIQEGQKQLVYYRSGIARGHGPDQQTLSFSMLYDVKKDTLSCKKDIRQLTNWEIVKLKKGNFFRNAASVTNFIVTDADF